MAASSTGSGPSRKTTPHVAPAGTRYDSIEDAGNSMLANYCHRFPNTDESTVLPQSFYSHYPEGHDLNSQIREHPRGLSAEERKRFDGIRINQDGELSEYKTFDMFYKLASTKRTNPFLALRQFKLDCDNAQDIRKLALEVEFNKFAKLINLTRISTNHEHDLIILIKNIGVLLVEVKSRSIGNAEMQLNVGLSFVRTLNNAITRQSNSPSPNLYPIHKLIIIPNNLSPSPTSPTYSGGSHVIHHDIMNDFDKFEQTFDDIVKEMSDSRATCILNDDDFARLASYMVGLWCMMPLKPVNSQSCFDETPASIPSQTLQTDVRIDQAHLSSDERTIKNVIKRQLHEKLKEFPVTYVERTDEHFQILNEISWLYMTPEQMELYKNFQQVIIRGVAGSGKTLLFCFKILDIIANDANKNVLIIAPSPHHLRLEKLLKANGVGNVTVTEELPPTPTNSVVIMDLEDFFGVAKKVLLSYDISSYHVFVDDMQAYNCGSDAVKYPDIALFVENTYKRSEHNNAHLWIGVDPTQGVLLNTDYGSSSIQLFHTNVNTPRQITIPVFPLTQILRNSTQITNCVVEARDGKISRQGASNAAYLQHVQAGHKIASSAVVYHHLKQVSDTKYVEQFIVERVLNEMRELLGQKYSVKHSQICILYDDDNTHIPVVQNILQQTFNIQTQTIEEELRTGNTNDIICDRVDKAMSFECTCGVLLISSSDDSRSIYNMLSRFRTRAIIIDYNVNKPPYINSNVVVLTWEEKDGTFVKV